MRHRDLQPAGDDDGHPHGCRADPVPGAVDPNVYRGSGNHSAGIVDYDFVCAQCSVFECDDGLWRCAARSGLYALNRSVCLNFDDDHPPRPVLALMLSGRVRCDRAMDRFACRLCAAVFALPPALPDRIVEAAGLLSPISSINLIANWKSADEKRSFPFVGDDLFYVC